MSAATRSGSQPSRSRRSRRRASHQARTAGDSAHRAAAATDNPRIAAIAVMRAISQQHGSFSDRLPLALAGLAPADRPRCHAWCFGLARHDILLQYRLSQLLDKPLKSRDADLEWLLKLGLYQLTYSEVPAPLVVSETVEIASLLDKDWARGLINAVLRRYLREREAGRHLPPDDPAIASAYPDWLYRRLQADWGEVAATVAATGNEQAPMTVRVTAGASHVGDTLDTLSAAGVSASPGTRAGAALVLDEAMDVLELPGFSEGKLTVQDESAQLAVELLTESVPGGGRLLDACAAPGGKTLHAIDSGHFTDIVALDVSADRLARIADALARREDRLAPSLLCADAGDVSGWWDQRSFDVVLLDAPCSGSGVIRRHPDIKLVRREADVEALVSQQAQLLDALWQVVKPGGYLMYCTCSIFASENEDQVKRFLARRDDASAVLLSARAGLARPNEQLALGRQWLPTTRTGGDGFWYSLLRRSVEGGA